MILSAIGVLGAVLSAWILTRPRFLRSRTWRATVTPLASIIGSGFLIVAPLLHAVLGKWALAGMVALAGVAYALGGVIRFNIAYTEEHIENHPRGSAARLEIGAQWCLGFAYAISVAFYVSLFMAFFFHRLNWSDDRALKWATTGLLVAIMCVAWRRGSRGLETIELIAVTIKLAIIIGVLLALAGFDLSHPQPWFQHEPVEPLSLFETASIVAGMIMVTQGFETARFMGAEYDSGTRVRAIAQSQRIALSIYIAFIGLTCPLFLSFPVTTLNETTISETLGQAVFILPALLLVAATASQLSAALADTLGGGGLLRERVPLNLPSKAYYVIVAGIAMILIWSSDVFEIINYASKGFAAYYLLQVLIALSVSRLKGLLNGWKALAGAILSLILAFVVFCSTPAPHG